MPIATFTFLRGHAHVNMMSALSFVSLYAKYTSLFEKQTPTLLSWPIYITIDSMVRPSTPFTSKTAGFRCFFVFLNHPVTPIMDSSAPEVMVESSIFDL